MTWRRVVIVGVLVVVLAGVAVGALLARDDDDPGAVVPPTQQPFAWDVTLDPEGRPYDVPLFQGSTVSRRPLTVLHAPSRRVLFMGGEYLPLPEASGATTTLAERPGRSYPVHAIWEERKRSGLRSIVGVVIVERDTPVVRWRTLHDAAYVTDGGTGGITTQEWAAKEKSHENAVRRLYFREFGRNREYFTADVDGHKGVDTIGFRNGWGDGVFPSIAGYDAAGERVEIVLWTKAVPWRLAFPEGAPPAEVADAEEQLAECIAGQRTIEGSSCRVVP